MSVTDRFLLISFSVAVESGLGLVRYRLCGRSVSSPGRREDLARAHLLCQHGASLETLHKNILYYSGNLG